LSGDGTSVDVVLFVDWQNVYRSARRAFRLGAMPSRHGNFSPVALGRWLATANGRGSRGRLVGVEIFRGLPSPIQDPGGHAANQRQVAAWRAEAPKVVVPRLRPLRYPPGYPEQPPVEKGVDVELAIAAVEAVLRRRCDVAIVFSHDSDLLPVPEAIARLVGACHVETAAWSSSGFRQRLRPKEPVVHHAIPESVFRAVETARDYSRRG
jgi:uncharacterized LabA/DUF88 family protein